MKKSLFECVHGRSGERLVQGILVFLLQNDEPLRAAFLKWCEWPNSCSLIDEEFKDGCHRHDLIFKFSDSSCKTLELKLWAGWTNAQSTDPARIDYVLVPRLRERDAIAVFGAAKVRTWESLLQEVAAHSTLANQMLHGFADYVWTGQSISKANLLVEISRWWKCGEDADPYRGSVFLNHCWERVKILGLDSTASSKLYRAKGYGYWGRYLSTERCEDYRQRLWFGFTFRMQNGEVERAEFALQALSAEVGRKIGLSSDLPDWYPWEFKPALGKIVPVNRDECYSVDDWCSSCSDIIKAYATL